MSVRVSVSGCVFSSQVSVKVKGDVGNVGTVQSKNMLLKCFSQHLTQWNRDY